MTGFQSKKAAANDKLDEPEVELDLQKFMFEALQQACRKVVELEKRITALEAYNKDDGK